MRATNAAIRQLAHDHPQTNPEIRNHQSIVSLGSDEYGKYPRKKPDVQLRKVLSTTLLGKTGIFGSRASEVLGYQLSQPTDVLLEGGPEF